ncbi:MAG TPA: serine--tRNA ligase [Pseudonocardiaceae bacterium]|nr:serine--tRNA ligase [Pseudonocardiaceae bacterium]
MHDTRTLLEPDTAARLGRRGHVLDPAIAEGVKRRAEAIHDRDALRAELRAARKGAEPADRAAARAGKARLAELEEDCRTTERELRAALLAVPNVPADEAPDGGPTDPPVEIREWGSRPEFDFAARDHVELGGTLGILDPRRAAKLSGARFAVTVGAGARLARALAAFLLDIHTDEHGYREYGLPHLVTPETMTGTGQLPKFADDLFGTELAGRPLLLIPTAEVPLVNLYRDEMLDEGALPLALTAHTSCYRSEAGSYGRDTKGLIRVHQFEKVELVRFCAAERSAEELDVIVGHAETCLRRLGLHYRVVDLRSGDLGFSARRTYDIEVWLPGQDAYREISSCSDCGTFQARRANIRMRRPGGEKAFPATLNGSALPIGRTMVAILEQYQMADGSVIIPPALAQYAGFSRLAPDGTPTDTLTGS